METRLGQPVLQGTVTGTPTFAPVAIVSQWHFWCCCCSSSSESTCLWSQCREELEDGIHP
jgi:hypothetical protein